MKEIFFIFALTFLVFGVTYATTDEMKSSECSSQFHCKFTQTCCKLSVQENDSEEFGCCPYENGSCCEDGLHCCPHQTTCDTLNHRCVQSRFLESTMFVTSDVSGVDLGNQGSRYQYDGLDPGNTKVVQFNPTPASNKIWKRCELARELLKEHGYPKSDLPDWMCLVLHESGFNSSKINTHNRDHSIDYGIFQINDNYWCGSRGKANQCGIDCEVLLSQDLTPSATCAMKIFLDSKRKKDHNGFLPWNGWKKFCSNGRVKGSDLDDCILDLDGKWAGTSHNTDGFHSTVELTCDSTWDKSAKCKVHYGYPCTGVWIYQGVNENGTIRIYESIGSCYPVQLNAQVSGGNLLEFQGYLPDHPSVIVYGTLKRLE